MLRQFHCSRLCNVLVALLAVLAVSLPQAHGNQPAKANPASAATASETGEGCCGDCAPKPVVTDCCATEPGDANTNEDTPVPCEPDPYCPCDCPCCGNLVHVVPMMVPQYASAGVLTDLPQALLASAFLRPDELALGVSIQPPIA